MKTHAIALSLAALAKAQVAPPGPVAQPDAPGTPDAPVDPVVEEGPQGDALGEPEYWLPVVEEEEYVPPEEDEEEDEDEEDDEDEDEYEPEEDVDPVDDAPYEMPVDPAPVDDPYVPVDPAPVDDTYVPADPVDDDYVPADDPVDTYTPAPVYDPPSQKACGTLYIDVISHYLKQILSTLPTPILDHILSLIKDLLPLVEEMYPDYDDAYYRVREHLDTVTGYCEEYVPEGEYKVKVLDVVEKCKETYEVVYSTKVDPPVYEAWHDLWDSCKSSTTPATIPEYYSAFTGYLSTGPDSTTYTAEIDALSSSSDPDVAYAADQTKDAIITLSQEANDDGSEVATSSVARLSVGLVSVVVAALLV